MTEQKLVSEIIDEVLPSVTLDEFLNRHPNKLKYPEDYESMVRDVLRPQRAQFIKGEVEKKQKKDDKANG